MQGKLEKEYLWGGSISSSKVIWYHFHAASTVTPSQPHLKTKWSVHHVKSFNKLTQISSKQKRNQTYPPAFTLVFACSKNSPGGSWRLHPHESLGADRKILEPQLRLKNDTSVCKTKARRSVEPRVIIQKWRGQYNFKKHICTAIFMKTTCPTTLLNVILTHMGWMLEKHWMQLYMKKIHAPAHHHC